MLSKLLFLYALLHRSICHPAELTNASQSAPVIVQEEIANLDNHGPFHPSMMALRQSVSIIDQTIKEVEELIESNSSLPRLTRGEIIELIENVTKDQLDETLRLRDQKSVMLVLPHVPESSDEANIQELFTKPPITHIVNETTHKIPGGNDIKGPIYKRRRRPILKIVQTSTAKIEPTTETSTSTEPTTTTETTRMTKPTSTQKPQTLEDISTEISVVTKSSESAQNNLMKRRRRPLKPPQVTPNHKYNLTDLILPSKVNEGLNIIAAPDMSIRKPFTTSTTSSVNNNRFNHQLSNVATSKPFSLMPEDTSQFFGNINLPNHLRHTLNELNVENTVEKIVNKNRLPEKVPEFTNKLPAINEDLMNVLKTYGAFPPIPFSTTTTSTTTPVPDVGVVADNLSPDMKQLLLSFGLLPDQNAAASFNVNQKEEEHIPFTAESMAEIDPNSYSQFKPLPKSVTSMNHMDDFLQRFGLDRKVNDHPRSEKSLDEKTSQNVLVDMPKLDKDMLPETMHEALSNLGLLDNRTELVETTKIDNETLNNSTTKTRQHVFNPNTTPSTTKEELEKLHQILDTIKQLDKLNRTADVLLEQIKHPQDTSHTLQDDLGPNPLNFDDGLEKNEVKRQQETTQVSISTEEPKSVSASANLKDLEESFGGTVGVPTEEATLPPPTSSPSPETGLYFLLDWNSFFDIDDQKGKRVNLRFQPKVGDSRKFFSVHVP